MKVYLMYVQFEAMVLFNSENDAIAPMLETTDEKFIA